ncbi:MAG: NERD domain-containing protein [Proteobacteria bacterium]|nr:NERD domain-containing protein [Pseudomonadota bacterium]
MAQNETQQIEIYIGQQIEHASERAVLDRLVHLLKRDQRPAIILSNFSLKARQIDFVVGLDDLALVVEAKGCSRPVRGGENGPWHVGLASGDWKDFRNPYVQARDAALAVKDAMRSFFNADVQYPSAALIFVPEIPRGSRVYAGDFKVSVTGLDGLHAALQTRQNDTWPLIQWREFAQHLRLTPVSTVATACDPSLAGAEDLLRRYTAAFGRTYTSAEPLIPFVCQSDGEAISSEDVARLVSEQHADILIRGPSGCGKTLLAAHAGLEFNRRGGVAITIPARNYTGSLKAVLDREASLLGAASAVKLLNAARRRNRPILFILDGYNECAESEQSSLTRGLAALARNYEGSVLITSQTPLARNDLLALRAVEVSSTSMETKIAIALNVIGGDALPREIKPLLDAVSTGLEARLVGEVGQQPSRGSSRYALFDAFARKRLGNAANDGIRTLTEVAAWLSDRIAFSLSIRDLDRLADAERVPQSLLRLLQTSGLLALRGDRVSFEHEMFFNAFAAEAVVRRTAGQSEPLLIALTTPQHAARKDFIIGAIDDDLLLEQVLEGVTDRTCVAACLSGACGRRAQEWAEARCLNLLERLREEVRNIRFRIYDKGWWNVAFEEDFLTTWSLCDRAFLAALPQLIAEGCYLDDILNIIGILDQRIAEEWSRLRHEASERSIALRSGLFANSYVFPFSATPGITQICSHLHGQLFWTTSDAVARVIERNLMGDDLSPGQLYLILMLRRGADIAASLITRALKTRWASAPYHLRLDLIDAAVVCQRANEADRTALIEAIEALPQPQHPFISTAIVDALRFLGGLETPEQEHQIVVREEISRCLTCPDDAETCAAAYGIYSAQFDHPFSGAYCEVVPNLSDDERKQLLMMAARGADDSTFFLSPLLIELASFGDPKVGVIIGRSTEFPPTDSFMPQDAIAVFVVAHVSLGRLGCRLPDRQLTTDNPSAEALAACGAILYWCNRADLDENTKRNACHHPLSILARHEQGAALDVIRDCEHALVEGLKHLPGKTPVERSIVGRFPAEVVEICRHALLRPAIQIGYFRHFSDYDRHQDLEFAINVLAHHGNTTHLTLLRRCAGDPALGITAIAAVKVAEQRMTTP